MKKKVIFLTLIIAVALMVLSTASFADARGRGNFAGKQGMPFHQGQNQHPSERFGFNQGDNYRGWEPWTIFEQMAQIRDAAYLSKENLDSGSRFKPNNWN